MNRKQHPNDMADIEFLSHKNGAIDYAAYDLRARQERSKALRTAVGSLVKFIRSALAEIRGSVAGMTNAVLQSARKCNSTGLQICQECPKPLGS